MKFREWLAQAATPIRTDEVVMGTSNPFTMADGVPTRAAPCLVCGQAAGGRLVVLHFVAGFDAPPCDCGNTQPVAFIRHLSCPDYDDQVLADLVIAAILNHHPREGDTAWVPKQS